MLSNLIIIGCLEEVYTGALCFGSTVLHVCIHVGVGLDNHDTVAVLHSKCWPAPGAVTAEL